MTYQPHTTPEPLADDHRFMQLVAYETCSSPVLCATSVLMPDWFTVLASRYIARKVRRKQARLLAWQRRNDDAR